MLTYLRILLMGVSLWAGYALMAQAPGSFDFIGGVDYVYRYWSEESGSKLDERPGWGWRAGVNFNYGWRDKWTFKTGLRLATVGYDGALIEGLNWGSEHNGMGGQTNNPDLPDKVQISHDMWLLELPLLVRRAWSSGQWQPYLEAGLAPNLLLGVRTASILDTEAPTREWISPGDDPRRLLQLVGQIGFGIQYQRNESWQWFAQPTFRYHLLSTTDGPIKEHPYSAGIETGIRLYTGW